MLCVTHAQAQQSFVLIGERTALFEKRIYSSPTGLTKMDYYVLKPINYDPGKSYPLVLNLHGASGHSWGAYVLSLPAMRQAYPAFVVVPKVDVQSWSQIAYIDIKPQALSHMVGIIEDVKKEFSIDGSRLYVTGYSMGGYGTFNVVAKNPGYFAAAAPLCGGGNTSDAVKISTTPLWVFHGSLDDEIPPEESRKMVRAIQASGGKPIYTEYPKVGHGVWNYAYQDPKFWQWLFSQKKP